MKLPVVNAVAEADILKEDSFKRFQAIVSAENNFLKQNTVLKSVDPSLSLGSVKKQIVLGQVIAKAHELKLKIDENIWSEMIDNEVKDSTVINNASKGIKTQIKQIVN